MWTTQYRPRESGTVTDKGGFSTGCVIVAHPDDETIWSGGTILMNTNCLWTIVSLCRGSDPDRAPKFISAAKELCADAAIGDLDDSTKQISIPQEDIEGVILSLLPVKYYDVIITHSPHGEYTRHRRHEETGRAVTALWQKKAINARELWMFAYRDSAKGGKEDLPHPIEGAHRVTLLPEHIWEHKYRIITKIYGFAEETYEAKVIQRKEAFWCFPSYTEFQEWLKTQGGKRESFGAV
ncbi:MAG: PIG-L family deacetylase [Dehalococcoidia bacterium]|nr:PIG-L family deacetylase [Dehalococcoidia bacterium]